MTTEDQGRTIEVLEDAFARAAKLIEKMVEKYADARAVDYDEYRQHLRDREWEKVRHKGRVDHLKSAPSAPLVIEADSLILARLPQSALALSSIILRFNHVETDPARSMARSIGESVFEQGGHPAMQLVFYFIQAMWAHGVFGTDRAESFHPSELSRAWEGIGVWRD